MVHSIGITEALNHQALGAADAEQAAGPKSRTAATGHGPPIAGGIGLEIDSPIGTVFAKGVFHLGRAGNAEDCAMGGRNAKHREGGGGKEWEVEPMMDSGIRYSIHDFDGLWFPGNCF